MNSQEIIGRGDEVFINTYARFPVVMERGVGCRLWDADGREYLDFLSGIAVCALGHCHPAVSAAVREQVERLVHVSNLFYTVPQTELAQLLVEHSFADRVFLANSGAEANEAALKLARIHGGPGRYEVISLEGSFHGRTLATVAATGQEKFHQGFEPLPQGFVHAPFGDLEALRNLVNERTCAVLCEPIQGESGVRPLGRDYLAGIREICDEHGLLLIFDEVQTGMGRTGTLFAYQQLGVVPDVMTLAKGLGGGMPIGAMLATGEIAASLGPGTHASTFGGNPVASAAATAVLKVMLEPGFLDGVRERGELLRQGLEELAGRHPGLASGVRGAGLLLGLVLTEQGRAMGADLVQAMFERGVLINFAGEAVLRCIPPLVVSEEEIGQLLGALDEVLQEVM